MVFNVFFFFFFFPDILQHLQYGSAPVADKCRKNDKISLYNFI